MASENLVNNLFEIVQSNTKEKLSYNDFEKDLLKNIKLPKDEIDRALSIILSQAEVNPSIVGESKGGTFILSPSFSASVIATIKYENQFIEGKAEYIDKSIKTVNNEDKLGLNDIIMTEVIMDNLIDNFGNLSDEEKGDLLASFTNMTEEQKDKVVEKHNDLLSELEKSPDVSEETKRTVKLSMQTNKFVRARAKRAKNGDKESMDVIKEQLKNFMNENKEAFNALYSSFFHGSDVDIDDLPADLILAMDNMRLSAVMQAQLIVTKDDKEKKDVEALKIESPKLSDETMEYLMQKFPQGTNFMEEYQLIDIKKIGYNPNDKDLFYRQDKAEKYIELKEFLDANDRANLQIQLVKIYGNTINKTFQKMFDEMQVPEEEKIKLMVMYADLLTNISKEDKEQLAMDSKNMKNILLNKAALLFGAEHSFDLMPLLEYDFNGKLPELLVKEPTELAAVLGTFLMKQVDGKDGKEQDEVSKFVEHLKGIQSEKKEADFEVSYMYVQGEAQLKIKNSEKSKSAGKELKDKGDKKLDIEPSQMTGLGEIDESSKDSEEKGGIDLFGELEGFSDDSEEKGETDLFGELEGFSDDSEEKSETKMFGNLKSFSDDFEGKSPVDIESQVSLNGRRILPEEIPVESREFANNDEVLKKHIKKYDFIFSPTAKSKAKDILKNVRFGEIRDENDAVRKAAEIMAKNMKKDETEEIKE